MKCQLEITINLLLILLVRGIVYKEQAQWQLRDEKEKITAIVNTAFDGIITINERGIIESFNPAACNMFGYQEVEVIGQKVNMLMPSPDREYHDLYIQNYIDSGSSKFIGKPGTVTAINKTGTQFPIEICIGAKKTHNQWMFTGICRLYHEHGVQSQADCSDMSQE
ncbi:MAG: PAS domain S-box protein [Gammaproteobacteria bacterium]|nr:PAS domain S-box protein [Gammaproteobacteria bacterium]